MSRKNYLILFLVSFISFSLAAMKYHGDNALATLDDARAAKQDRPKDFIVPASADFFLHVPAEVMKQIIEMLPDHGVFVFRLTSKRNLELRDKFGCTFATWPKLYSAVHGDKEAHGKPEWVEK